MIDFSKDYESSLIMKAFRQRRNLFTNEVVTDFIKTMMDKISQWPIETVRLIISIVIVHSSFSFELIPTIMNSANLENKLELIEFMAYETGTEYCSEEVSKWLK